MNDPEFERLFARYMALFERQHFDESSLDDAAADRHLTYLRQLAAVENSSVAVMDACRRRYRFVQSRFLPMLGIPMDDMMQRGPRALYEIMHPQDVRPVIGTLTEGMDFLLSRPAEEKKEWKIVYDFRLMSADGTYVRFLQQLLPLELDTRGNIWLMLMINDVAPARSTENATQRMMMNVTNGVVHPLGEGSGAALSKREVEVLRLISQGKRSKEVAEELFLSVNTVNNHRRNILEKTNVGTTAEAIRYAMGLGLI